MNSGGGISFMGIVGQVKVNVTQSKQDWKVVGEQSEQSPPVTYSKTIL